MSSFAEAFWKGHPRCPYCGSQRATAHKDGKRFQCYSCFTAFSATTGTIAHRTHLSLPIWSLAASELDKNPKLSIRKLANLLKVSNKTAARIKMKLSSQEVEYRMQINAIIINGGLP
ncbi:transposase [Deinococcus frigens]|uniref:transposase n=1 Tax=Deinococcus frigens TaxID=249403 RepID=UPI0009FDB584|nr:transposase [Deinococcus frigens]